jgi:hypothetical protein
MSQRIASLAMAAAMTFSAAYAIAKIPPPPPPTEAQKAAAEAKKASAEKAKADLAAAEERAIANYHQNMKKMGKPVPKPMAVSQAPTSPTGAKPAPQGNTQKAAGKK